MEKFIVSARKYRPQNFSTVVGQSHITTTLKNAIRQDQLAHAFLFTGPRGVGKTTCARILAKTINCENLQEDGEACNTCTSCVNFNAGSSLNIHELDAASNNSVDDIRALTEQVRYAPQAAKYKVYIIDEVHMLSASAFNAFLKTLEEPPSYAIFILATTEKHKILPTILSRCQIFDFRRITTADTVEHLEEIITKEHITAEKPALQVIAQKSEGCMRDALSILDKIVSFTGGSLTYNNTLEHLNILDEDYYFKLLDMLYNQDLAGALLLYDEINRKGFEGEVVITGLAEFFRNLMVCSDPRTVVLLDVVESFKEKYKVVAEKMPLAFLISGINILNESELSYKQAKNKKLHLELMLIRMAYLRQAINVEVEGEGAVKKKRIDSLRAIGFRKLSVLDLNTGSQKETAKPKVQPSVSENNGASLHVDSGLAKKLLEPIVHSPSPAPIPHQADIAVTTPKTPKPTLGALAKIRQKIVHQNAGEKDVVIPLEEESLKKAWDEYIIKLTEDKNHSTATNFKFATLVITGPASFDILTDTNIQQRFIEQERGALIDHLQQFFNNRQLNYQVSLKPQTGEPEVVERPLTMREQYFKIVEEYPLIKELRDRLNLDLDF